MSGELNRRAGQGFSSDLWGRSGRDTSVETLERERFKPADRGLPFYLLQYRDSKDIRHRYTCMSRQRKGTS